MDSSVHASSWSAWSLSASRNGESSTSPSSRQVREREEAEAEDTYRHQQPVQQQTGLAYHTDFPSAIDETSTLTRDDFWSCVIVVFTFWFFVSMTLMLGVYGSVTIRVGPNCSLLIQPSHLFVDYIKVEEFDEIKHGLMLYGLYKGPLVYATAWSDHYTASLPAGSHEEWIYCLNGKSQINISYSVNSPSTSSLILIIAQGDGGFSQWLEDPSYPNGTLLWKLIHGSGIVQQDILKSSSYYVALGNVNFEEVEVQLNLSIRGFQYNTTEAYYNCNLAHGPCSLKLFFPNGNAAVLTSPASEEGIGNIDSYVRLSYGPRWITYLAGIGGLTLLVLLALHIFKNFHCTRNGMARVQFGEMGSERAPLLSHKDDDLSSWGSSYESVSDDEDPEDGLAVGSLEGKAVKDGGYNNNIRRLCAICFDAPRDCFFLPCGHCVACFACGSRIAELAGTCPICRRNMKKVRKIFTV